MFAEPCDDLLACYIECRARSCRLAIMGECEVEADHESRIDGEAHQSQERPDETLVSKLAHAEEGDEGGADDVECGEAQCLERSPDEAEGAAACQEIAIDDHLDREKEDEKADLDPPYRRIGINGGPA